MPRSRARNHARSRLPRSLLATTLAGLADGSIETGAVVDGQTTVPATGQAH